MSFYDEEISSENQPVELFYFFSGNNFKRYYTSSDKDLVYNGVTYTAIPIRRSNILNTDDLSRSPVNIELEVSDHLIQGFITAVYGKSVNVIVYRKHDAHVAVFWQGRVITSNISGNICTLNCESILTAIKRTGLKEKFQISCRHVLYSDECRVNQNNYLTNLIVTEVNDNVITVTGITQSDNYFKDGFVVFDNYQYRGIIRNTSTVITLDLMIPKLEIGDTLKCYPGCNYLRSTCEDKFNNDINYGGFPWIPSKNPFSDMLGGI